MLHQRYIRCPVCSLIFTGVSGVPEHAPAVPRGGGHTTPPRCAGSSTTPPPVDNRVFIFPTSVRWL